MGDNKISEAAVEAACSVIYHGYVTGKKDYRRECEKEARAALEAALPHLQGEAVPVAWQSMATCPRDGRVVLLRWGEDHVSPGWWSAPVSPVQNDDGTWPSDTGGFPWAFFDRANRETIVNHAADTKYGPTHWAPYTHPQPAELSEVSGDSGELPPLPTPARESVSECGPDYFDASQMRQYARAALAATSKQQVGEVQGSPMAKMAAALRQKAADERAEYLRQTQKPVVAEEVKGSREQFEAWANMVDLSCARFNDGGYCDERTVSAWLSWLASRQPVGAQGIDLGQFRDLIGFAVYQAIYLPESDPRRDFIRQANELLALIDGRDAGTGVGHG